MKITITGRSIELTEGLKAAAEQKLGRLDKYFAPDTPVYVTMSLQREMQKCEVTIPIKGHVIRSEQATDDMYITLDLVADMIEKQLKKYRTRLVSRKMNAAESFAAAYLQQEEEPEEEEVRIVRTKRIEMKPMFPEDACIQMELTGHDFYVFRNAETDEINVVYRRKGSTYGLIEPD